MGPYDHYREAEQILDRIDEARRQALAEAEQDLAAARSQDDLDEILDNARGLNTKLLLEVGMAQVHATLAAIAPPVAVTTTTGDGTRPRVMTYDDPEPS